MQLQEKISDLKKQGKKSLAVLLDPDKVQTSGLSDQIKALANAGPDFFFVGGSLITGNSFHILVEAIKYHSQIPVIIFPGSNLHIHGDADGILLLSLISGRNAELLIGQHVLAAPILKNSGLEILPTGYMLVESGRPTTVSYISNTQPIPSNKPEIAACTAMAGEMLGLKLLYLDGGSGALNPIPADMISAVRACTEIPVLVGGGINSAQKAEQAWKAGADCIVIGNALESASHLLEEITSLRNKMNLDSGKIIQGERKSGK